MTRCRPARSDLEQLYRQGKWDASLVEEALALAENSGEPCDWLNLVDISQAIKGLTLRDWQHVANHYSANRYASPKLLLKLINLIACAETFPALSTAERASRRIHLLSSAQSSSINCIRDLLQSGYLGTRLSHYPCLLTQEESLRRTLSANVILPSRRTLQAATELQVLTRPFEELIRHGLGEAADTRSEPRRPRVAVVGNSPAILQSHAGTAIDAADLVVRFNTVSADPGKFRHTGSRTDIWVMSPSTPLSSCPDDARGIIVSGLNSLTRPSFYWKTLPTQGRYLSECPASRWHELVACFKAPPSAGTLLLASLKSMNLDVQCHGFTRCVSEHEAHGNHHADNQARSLRHNWEAEARWLVDCFP